VIWTSPHVNSYRSRLKWVRLLQCIDDGAFGRSTRGSMADWQEANGYEATALPDHVAAGRFLIANIMPC